MGDTPITPEEIKILLCALERRGNHATGIALMTNNEIHVCKDAKPAWAFVGDKSTDEFLDAFLTQDTTMALLHTRLATVGNPRINANNHPMYLGRSAVVHNGGVPNQSMIFNTENLGDRSCETDSDVFRAILDKQGLNETAIQTMNRLSGSAAIAAFTADDPNSLLLARSGSPLVYATSEDKLWWASETQAIQKAVRPWTNHHGLPARSHRSDVSYFTMPDHTAYIIRPGERPIRREFKVCAHYNKPDYSHIRTNYGTKMAGFRASERFERKEVKALPLATVVESPRVAMKYSQCPSSSCKAALGVPGNRKFADFTCPKCFITLSALDKLLDSDLRWEN